MALNLLSDTKIRQAQKQAKPYKLHDGAGLYAHIVPNGSKYWRLKFRFGGKERVYAIGIYPEMSLAAAREEALKARQLIRDGIDPVAERKQRRAGNNGSSGGDTFQSVAEEWIETKGNIWSTNYKQSVKSTLERNLFPHIGKLPINSITVPVMRDVLRIMEKREALVVLSKAQMWAAMVFRYAISTGRADKDNNPAYLLQGTFKQHKARKVAAIIKPDEFGELVKKIRTYDGSIITRLALLLMVHTFLRTTELTGAKWAEFDFTKAEWTVPADRMKMKEAHVVPLSRQALAILKELHPLTGHSEFVFPSEKSPHKHISDNTMLFALYRLGYHSRATVHGFRSSASSMLNKMGFNWIWVERQLSHKERNKIRGAYDREEYLEERHQMMQRWADFIDGLVAKDTACMNASFKHEGVSYVSPK